jgi:DnaJ-class molecular chaperone
MMANPFEVPPLDRGQPEKRNCDKCRGTGKVGDKKCDRCNGSGKVR